MDQDCNVRLNIASERVGVALDKLGQEGWEFVGQGLNDGINNNYLIFKRPLE